MRLIDKQPTISPVLRDKENGITYAPVKHGQWKHDKDDVIISGYCSECGWTSIICETDVAGMPYCPNCGAKMEEEQDE